MGERLAQAAPAVLGEVPAQRRDAADMVQERRRSHLEPGGQRAQGEPGEPLGVGQPGGRGDHLLLVEAGARHAQKAQPTWMVGKMPIVLSSKRLPAMLTGSLNQL